jgi:metal-responsive CopG/Arc/MetJ family transcriptional regulator
MRIAYLLWHETTNTQQEATMQKERITIALDKELVDRVDRIADTERRSRSNMIEVMIDYYLNTQGKGE